MSDEERDVLKNERFPSLAKPEQRVRSLQMYPPPVDVDAGLRVVRSGKINSVTINPVDVVIENTNKPLQTPKSKSTGLALDSSGDDMTCIRQYRQHKIKQNNISEHGSLRTEHDSAYEPMELLEMSLKEGATPDQWKMFFGLMSFGTHQKAGTGLIEEIGRIGANLQAIRKRKRSLTDSYLNEIGDRYAKVQKHKHRIDTTMNSLKKRGQRMVNIKKSKRGLRG